MVASRTAKTIAICLLLRIALASSFSQQQILALNSRKQNTLHRMHMDYRPQTWAQAWAWFHTVNITVGSPPQSFRAVVDIGFTDLLIPSIDCLKDDDDGFCETATNLYKSSASETNVIETGPDAQVGEPHFLLGWVGTKNRDTIRLGDLELADFAFMNAETISAQWMAIWNYDAVLGFPRHPCVCNSSTPGIACELKSNGPFHTMVQRGLLDKNIFGLAFPITAEPSSSGFLTLGAIDDTLYDGEFMTLPISKAPETNEEDTWHVQLHSFTFGDLEFTLPAHHAYFSSLSPHIWMPRDMRDMLFKILDVEFNDLLGVGFVDCNKRSGMPDLFFTLGPERLIVGLSPWQYIQEFEAVPGKPDSITCFAPFMALDKYDKPFGYGFIFGLGFLRSFYSVFNIDDNTISLAYRELPDPTVPPPRRCLWTICEGFNDKAVL